METTKRQFKLFSPRRQQLFSFYGQWTVSIAWTILSKLWFGLKLRTRLGLGWVWSLIPRSVDHGAVVWILLKMDKEPPLSPFKSTTRSITPQSTKVRLDCNLLVKFSTSWWNFEPADKNLNLGNSNFSNSKFKYFIDWSSESFNYSRRNRRSSFNVTVNLNCLCFTG